MSLRKKRLPPAFGHKTVLWTTESSGLGAASKTQHITGARQSRTSYTPLKFSALYRMTAERSRRAAKSSPVDGALSIHHTIHGRYRAIPQISSGRYTGLTVADNARLKRGPGNKVDTKNVPPRKASCDAVRGETTVVKPCRAQFELSNGQQLNAPLGRTRQITGIRARIVPRTRQ